MSRGAVGSREIHGLGTVEDRFLTDTCQRLSTTTVPCCRYYRDLVCHQVEHTELRYSGLPEKALNELYTAVNNKFADIKRY